MTSKTQIINLLREKGEEQLEYILQYTDHKPHMYKKMLKNKEAKEITKAKHTYNSNNMVEEVPIEPIKKKKIKNKK